jgi:HAD superfamily hydrolase (TIGR01457 family)
VLDLDGVLYRGDTAISGAQKTVTWLRRQGLQVFFLTNNSTQTRADYVAVLGKMGIPCQKDEVFSSSYAAGLYLGRNGAPPTALVVGEGGLAKELRAAGLKVIRRAREGNADFVVVGMDRRLTYQKIADAQCAIMRGAKFIATNRDPVYPVEHGLIPGGGTIVAAIETASLTKPLVIGKPSSFMLKLLLKRAGLKPNQALMVGDRMDTDIVSAKRAGVNTVLVLTGVTCREEAGRAKGVLRPHWVIDSIADLPNLLSRGKKI